MVYRDLPIEEAQKRFAEVTTVPEGTAKADEEITTKVLEKPKPKRKTVKALVPKNK